jgi:hypothetical protein
LSAVAPGASVLSEVSASGAADCRPERRRTGVHGEGERPPTVLAKPMLPPIVSGQRCVGAEHNRVVVLLRTRGGHRAAMISVWPPASVVSEVSGV